MIESRIHDANRELVLDQKSAKLVSFASCNPPWNASRPSSCARASKKLGVATWMATQQLQVDR